MTERRFREFLQDILDAIAGPRIPFQAPPPFSFPSDRLGMPTPERPLPDIFHGKPELPRTVPKLELGSQSTLGIQDIAHHLRNALAEIEAYNQELNREDSGEEAT